MSNVLSISEKTLVAVDSLKGPIGADGADGVAGPAGADGPSSIATGSVYYFAGASAPSGWLALDGGEHSRATESALFALFGTTHGAGDGSTTFNLPDCRGRVVLGVGQGAGLTDRALGSLVGAESVVLDGDETGVRAHTHGVSETPHSHGYLVPFPAATNYGIGTVPIPTDVSVYSNASTSASNANVTIDNAVNAQASSAHQNMQPSIVLLPIIKT